MADKIVQGYDVYGGYVYPFACIDGLVKESSSAAESQSVRGGDAIVESIKGKDVSLGDLDCSVGVGVGDYFSVGNVGGTPTFNMGYADASIETISAVNINKSTLNISNSVNAHGSVTVDNGQNNSSTGASESLSWSNGELVFKQSKNGGSLTEYLKIDSSKGIIMKGGGSRDVSIGDVSMFYLKSNDVSVSSTNNVDVSFGNLFSVHSGYDVSVITKYYDDGTKTHGMQLQHNGGYAEIDLFRTKYNGTGYNVVDINGSNAIRLWSNGDTIGSNRDFDASLADSSISLDKYPAFEVYNNGANQVVGIQNATINFVNGRRVNKDADKERVGIHSFKGENKLTLWSSVYNYSDASKKDSESEIFMTAYGSAIKGYDKLGTNGNAYISVKSARKWDSGDEDYYQCGYITLHSSDNVCVDSPKFSVGYGNAKRLLVNSDGTTVYNPIYCGKSGAWTSAGSNSMLKFNSTNSKVDAGDTTLYAPLWYAVDHFGYPWSIGLYSSSKDAFDNSFNVLRYDMSMTKREKTWQFKYNGDVSIPGTITAKVNNVDDVAVGCPIGSIIAWPGDSSHLPDGWTLCDGKIYHVGTEIWEAVAYGNGGNHRKRGSTMICAQYDSSMSRLYRTIGSWSCMSFAKSKSVSYYNSLQTTIDTTKAASVTINGGTYTLTPLSKLLGGTNSSNSYPEITTHNKKRYLNERDNGYDDTYKSTVPLFIFDDGSGNNSTCGWFASKYYATAKINGVTTEVEYVDVWFIVPNMCGRVLVGSGTGTDKNNNPMPFHIGNQGGEYRHQLTINEMPSHSHKWFGDDELIGFESRWGAASGAVSSKGYDADSTSKPTDGSNIYYTSNTGADYGHDNIQPYMVLNYIIKYK